MELEGEEKSQKQFFDIFQKILKEDKLGEKIVLHFGQDEMEIRGRIGANHGFKAFFPSELFKDFFEGEIVLQTDREKFKEIIDGILTIHELDNTLKFSTDGSRIFVDYEAESVIRTEDVSETKSFKMAGVMTPNNFSEIPLSEFNKKLTSLKIQAKEEEVEIVLSADSIGFNFGGGGAMVSGSISDIPCQSDLDKTIRVTFDYSVVSPMHKFVSIEEHLEDVRIEAAGNKEAIRFVANYEGGIDVEIVFAPRA